MTDSDLMSSIAVEAHAGKWRVIRHGGASTHKVRVAFAGAEAAARGCFADAKRDLRQGSVWLVSDLLVVLDRYTAPRLRSRW